MDENNPIPQNPTEEPTAPPQPPASPIPNYVYPPQPAAPAACAPPPNYAYPPQPGAENSPPPAYPQAPPYGQPYPPPPYAQCPYPPPYPQQGAPGMPYPPYPPYGQPGAVPPAPPAPGKAALLLKTFGEFVKKAAASPATALQEFAASGQTGHAYLLTALKALSFALFMLVMALRLNGIISDVMDNLFNGFLFFRMPAVEFPPFLVFVVSLVVSAGLVFLFAAILFFVSKVILKQETNYQQMLRVAAGKNLADIPFCLLGLLVTLINPVLGAAVALLGVLLSIFFAVYAYKGALPAVSADKRLYTLFVSLVALLIVSALVTQIVSPLCLPDLSKFLQPALLT